MTGRDGARGAGAAGDGQPDSEAEPADSAGQQPGGVVYAKPGGQVAAYARAHRKRRIRLVVWVSLVGVAAVAGVVFCVWLYGFKEGVVTVPKGEELEQQYREHKQEYQKVVDEVFAFIKSDAPPDDDPLEGPSPCGNQEQRYRIETVYSFGNQDGWRIPGSVSEYGGKLVDYLEDHGWEVSGGRHFGDGLDITQIDASYPGVIDRLVVSFHPGPKADGVTFFSIPSVNPATMVICLTFWCLIQRSILI